MNQTANITSTKTKIKNLYLKNKKIFFFVTVILIVLTFVIVIYLFNAKKQNHVIENKKFDYGSNSYTIPAQQLNSFDPNYLVFLQPFPNSTPLFETSQESSDKKNIWSFVKNNFKLTSESAINDYDRNSYLPFVVKNNRSNYRYRISGFSLGIDEIKNSQERVSVVKKIEQQIINLGYKLVPTNFKTNVFEIVSEYSYGTDIFVKDNQVFYLWYIGDDCDGQKGGCYILLSYFNNIDKQIKSQQIIFNKLSPSINTYPTLNQLTENNAYFENNYNSIVIDKYKIFTIGHYDADVWAFLTEQKNDGSLEIVAIYPSEDKIEYDASILEKIPTEISCAFKSVYYDGMDSEITKGCSKYLKPSYSPIY